MDQIDIERVSITVALTIPHVLRGNQASEIRAAFVLWIHFQIQRILDRCCWCISMKASSKTTQFFIGLNKQREQRETGNLPNRSDDRWSSERHKYSNRTENPEWNSTMLSDVIELIFLSEISVFPSLEVIYLNEYCQYYLNARDICLTSKQSKVQ